MTNLLSAEFLAELEKTMENRKSFREQDGFYNPVWKAARAFHDLAPLLRELVEKREKATDGEWFYGFKDGSGMVEDRSGGCITAGRDDFDVVVMGCDFDGIPVGVTKENDALFIASAANIAAQIKRKVGE